MCTAHFMLCQPELNVFKLRNTAFHNTKYMKKQICNNFLKLKQQITQGKMQGNFPSRTSVFYRKERMVSAIYWTDIWLEASQASNNQYDLFFFFSKKLFGSNFRNKSFTICFTSSLPSKLPFLSLPRKLNVSSCIKVNVTGLISLMLYLFVFIFLG